MQKKKHITVTVDNHFDLGWRRSQDKPLVFQGKNYIPYADIQRYNIEDNMALCDRHPGYRFNIESVYVVRNYLEKHPDQAERLRRLYREGRCYTPLSGENIMDINMPGGESVVMNFVRGKHWIEKELGYTPRLAVRNDAFGNSAQLPQILNKCGIRWLNGIHYSRIEKEYWKGLDGSVLYCGNIPVVGNGGGWRKYAPCPVCRGFGRVGEEECTACGGRGIDRSVEKKIGIGFSADRFGTSDNGCLVINSEELIPGENIFSFIKEHEETYDFRFGKLEDAYAFLSDRINALPEDPGEYHESAELNPNNTGCYVSRIRTKQWVRDMENRLGALETLSVMTENGKADADIMEALWRSALYCMGHDQVTAEHVDIVYRDIEEKVSDFRAGEKKLLDFFSGKGDGITVCNTLSERYHGLVALPRREGAEQRLVAEDGTVHYPAEAAGDNEYFLLTLPPFSANRFAVIAGERETPDRETDAPEDSGSRYAGILQGNGNSARPAENSHREILENEYYRLTCDGIGILSVWDKEENREICRMQKHRVGQLVYEHDEGSPWATLSPERSENPLCCEVAGVDKNDSFERIVYRCRSGISDTGAIEGLEACQSITLYRGIKRIDFAVDVRWDDYNQRLKAVFPVVGNAGKQYFYEIPYGFIRRDSYAPVYSWAGSNGDWPAVHWAGMNVGKGSVALLNRGLPCNRMENGEDGEAITLSLLRCPSIPTYLHEPQSYSMTDWDGMRDAGEHRLEFALTSYGTALENSSVVADGAAYNRMPAVLKGNAAASDLPGIDSENVRISAVKAPMEGDGVILRLAEYRGRNGNAALLLPPRFREAYLCTLDEKALSPLPVNDGRLTLDVGKFEIVTVKLL